MMKSFSSSSSLLLFVVMMMITTILAIVTPASTAATATTLPKNGFFCGSTTLAGQGVETLLQIHDNLLSILISTGTSAANRKQCEFQYILSHQYTLVQNPTLQNPNAVQWSQTKVLSEDQQSSGSSSCSNISITGPLNFAPNAQNNGDMTMFFTLNVNGQQYTDVSRGYCVSQSTPYSRWMPSGYYCTNVANNVGLAVGPKNNFDVDLLGIAVKGRATVNVQTGQMALFAFGEDISAFFSTLVYNSSTGVIIISGEFQGYEINVQGGRAFCERPDTINNNVNLVTNGSYCGSSQAVYVGLTFLEGHLFVLNYGGLCTGTGYYTETKSTTNPNDVQLNFFFSQYSACLQNVSITSAISSAPNYGSIAVSFFGGDGLGAQSITLSNSTCENVPFTLPSIGVIPNGLYCVDPAVTDTLLPGRTLGVSIFGDASTKQRYQVWSGDCEAHGWLTVDAASGIVTLHDHVQTASCPASNQVEVVGAKWSSFSNTLALSVRYQGLVINIVGNQMNCPKNTPSGIINSLPSGLYCNGSSGQSAFPSITVIQDTLDVAVSDSCSVQGKYLYQTNGQVNLTITSLSNNCNDFFLHTLTFTPPTPVTPATFNFRGYYAGSSFEFDAVNCTHPARTSPVSMTTLCFQVADNGGTKHWGYALLGKTYARLTLGACVINADFKVSTENVVTDYKVSSFTSECGTVSMQIMDFAHDGTDAAIIRVTNWNTASQGQDVTASRQCPTTLTTTTTTTVTSTTTSVPTPVPPTPAPPAPTPQPSSAPVPTPAPPTPAPSTSSPTTPVPSTTPAPPTPAPPTPQPSTTTTLPPTLPVGTYNFNTGSTSNSLAGSLTVSPTTVVLAIGSCSEDGTLVAQQSNQNNYDFVANTKNAGCTSTQVSAITFTKNTNNNGNSNGNNNQLSVTGTVNGQSFSAAAAPASNPATTVPPSSPSNDGGSFPVGAAVGGAIGGLILIAVVAFLYMRKKGSSEGTGHATFNQKDNRSNVNEEMLASAVSTYQNYDDRLSTVGHNDQHNGLDI